MKLHQKIASIFGYEMIRKKKLGHLLATSHLKLLLDKLKINCILDVGANIGQFADKLRDSGYEGWIFSFEPIQDNYKVLVNKSRQDDRWLIFNMALGSVSTIESLNITKATAFASFHSPNKYSHNRFGDQQVDIARSEDVQVERLDNILGEIIEYIASPQIFLKMDTQGYDVEVFKGSEKVLDKIKGLQSEISFQQIYKDMPDYSESLGIYRNKGFEVTGLYPVSRDHTNMTLIEMDCFMVRKDIKP